MRFAHVHVYMYTYIHDYEPLILCLDAPRPYTAITTPVIKAGHFYVALMVHWSREYRARIREKHIRLIYTQLYSRTTHKIHMHSIY